MWSISIGAGVHHHRRVTPVEGAPFEHEDLAAAALLGRRAEHLHGDAEVVGQGGQSQAGADRRRGDDVVPAGVTDAGEGVVLGADGDGQRPAAGGGDEGRRQVGTRPMSTVNPPALKGLGDPRDRLLLLEGQLGIGVEQVGQLDERIRGLVDWLRRPPPWRHRSCRRLGPPVDRSRRDGDSVGDDGDDVAGADGVAACDLDLPDRARLARRARCSPSSWPRARRWPGRPRRCRRRRRAP